MQVWALIADTFRESIDKRLFWVLLLVSAVLVAVMACINFDERGLSLVFGMWKIDSPMFTRGSEAANGLVLQIIASGLIENYLAWFGVLLCLVATSSFLPAMLERGSVDVVLGKPISRPVLFLGKYLGALTFVAFQATALILPVVLVVGANLGLWLWKLLWCIPLLIALFSYVYCVAALTAVGARGPISCLVYGLVFWAVVSLINTGYLVMESLELASGWGWQAARAVHAALPKTYDVGPVAANLINAPTVASSFAAAGRPPDRPARAPKPADGNPTQLDAQDLRQMEAMERRVRDINLPYSIGSSLAFEAAVVILACWRFSRRDY